MDTAYWAVLFIGLLHGLDPGHGWPIAFFYSITKTKKMLAGLITSGLLAFFHFLASIIAVVIYVLLQSYFNFSFSWLNYVAAGILAVLGLFFWSEDADDLETTQHGHLHGNTEPLEHEHEHTHPNQLPHTHMHKHQKSTPLTLSGIALYAFILGFAHEEQFALLALVVGNVNPWILMIIYGLAVTASLIGITLLCIKAYEWFAPRLQRIAKFIPKITAITLFLLAVLMIFNII